MRAGKVVIDKVKAVGNWLLKKWWLALILVAMLGGVKTTMSPGVKLAVG